MPEGQAQMTEQEFKDKFPVGTHINYGGTEYVVLEHSKPGAEGIPHFHAVEVGGTEEFDMQEYADTEFEIHESPTKVPQKTEYPPQVFLVAWDDDGTPNAAIYKDLGAVKQHHPDLDGDTIMEAISDPGATQNDGDLSITFAAIG